MSLTPEKIQAFEQALNGPAPSGDPNWEVTQGLLKLVVAQGREIISLQEQLAAMTGASSASTQLLVDALQQSTGKTVAGSGLSQADVNAGIEGLNTAIQQYQQGQNVMHYAGNALKFALLFI